MTKEEKLVVIDSLAEQLQAYPHFYIADIESLNAEQTAALRRQRNMGGQLRLVHFGCNSCADHGRTMSVAYIIQNNKYRSDTSLLASHHGPKIRIKNIPSFNYHTIHTPFYFYFSENKYFQLFSCVYMCGIFPVIRYGFL